MFRYQAPKPGNQRKSLFSSLSSFSSSKSLGKVILPAQKRVAGSIDQSTYLDIADSYGLVINTGIVGTHDHAMLDTIEIKPAAEALLPIEEQHYIVKFNGNGMHYQDRINELVRDANQLESNIIAFNYRGVGNSVKQPDTIQDLITDGIAQVQRLIDSGVDSTKITLDGISLGGGVSVMVAHYFHQKNINLPVYIWPDRSFASLSKAAAGMFAPKSKGISSSCVTSSLETSASCVMVPAGWDIDVAKAYNEIDPAYKGYMYVAKQSQQSNGDGVISHPASLHKGVKAFENKNGLHTGHKVFANVGNYGGHNLPRDNLRSEENPELNGQDLFDNFVRSHRK